jgi:hypothetical protein
MSCMDAFCAVCDGACTQAVYVCVMVVCHVVLTRCRHIVFSLVCCVCCPMRAWRSSMRAIAPCSLPAPLNGLDCLRFACTTSRCGASQHLQAGARGETQMNSTALPPCASYPHLEDEQVAGPRSCAVAVLRASVRSAGAALSLKLRCYRAEPLVSSWCCVCAGAVSGCHPCRAKSTATLVS